jgi:hypothetical protein
MRVAGTGEWLLASEKFIDWRDGSSETLWCPGGREFRSLCDTSVRCLNIVGAAGVGKTILS